MDDPGGVGRRERCCYLLGDVNGNGERQLATHACAQSDTFNKLRRDKVAAMPLSDLINSENVRVVECRRGQRLLTKALYLILIMREVFGQQLQRNPTTEPSVFGQVNASHATRAN